MKTFALLSLLVASAVGGAIVEESFVEPLPTYTQESNTATGEYAYSYSGGPSAKTEFRARDGTTTGSYSYVDAHGILQTVNYIADEFGFRVAGTNVPVDGVTPLDAPDVAAVKAAHLAEHSRQTFNALTQRKKRSLFAAVPAAVEVRSALPAIATTSYTQHLPVATSHQSRFQIHNGAKIIEEVHTPAFAAVHATPLAAVHSAPLFLRKKRGALLAEAPIVAAAPLPPTTAKIYDELAQKPILRAAAPLAVAAAPAVHAAPALYAAPTINAAPAAVEVRSAIPAISTTSYTQHLPVATSHQSRFQIHNGAKVIEQTSLPVYAPAIPAAPIAPLAPAYPAFAPAYPGFAPAFPGFAPAFPAAPAPAFPAESIIADSDAIAVDSA